MRFGIPTPLLQYFCSECGLLLKQTEIELKHAQLGRGGGQGEECPKCGFLLSDTLQQRRRTREGGHAPLVTEIEEDFNDIPSQSSLFIPRFQTADEEYNNNSSSSSQFGFDIHKVDSFLNLNGGESLCIMCEQKYAQLFVARLCVNALMMMQSKRRRKKLEVGGEKRHSTEKHIIFIDAGNDFDIYQYVNFARQYGLDIKKFLQSIVASRMFTIYQLANTIIYDLPKVIIQHLQEQQQQQNFEPKVIVISDLLDMFVNDPHIKVEEAKNLLKEIMVSILRTRIRTREILGNCLIVISLSCRHQRQQQQESLQLYNKILLPRFDKSIEIIDGSISGGRSNGSFKVKTTTNNKNDHRAGRQSKLFSVTERDLLIPVPF
jgi:hypothetical protein